MATSGYKLRSKRDLSPPLSLPPNRSPVNWSPEIRRQAVELYNSGMTKVAVAKALKVPGSTIRTWLKPVSRDSSDCASVSSSEGSRSTASTASDEAEVVLHPKKWSEAMVKEEPRDEENIVWQHRKPDQMVALSADWEQ